MFPGWQHFTRDVDFGRGLAYRVAAASPKRDVPKPGTKFNAMKTLLAIGVIVLELFAFLVFGALVAELSGNKSAPGLLCLLALACMGWTWRAIDGKKDAKNETVL